MTEETRTKLPAFDAVEFFNQVGQDKHDIPKAMSDIADFIAYYGHYAGQWDGVVERKKLELENCEAEVELDTKSGGTKVTEATAKAMVANHATVQKLKLAVRVAKDQAASYKNAVSAFDTKGRMLSSRGAISRQELASTGLHSAPASNDESPNYSRESRREIGRRLGS